MEVISCSICLNSASILHKITELTENEVLTPMFKLITCLPNIVSSMKRRQDVVCYQPLMLFIHFAEVA